MAADLSDWAASQPDAPAIVATAGRRTFRELDDNANRLARALRRRGLRPGDAVALLSGNRAEFAEVYFACLRSGLRLTPVNWHLTGDEAGYIVADCEAKAIVTDHAAGALARAALAASPSCHVALAFGGAVDSFERYEDALDAEAADTLEAPTRGGTMLYTSGTTGRPKGVFRPTVSSPVVANLYGYNETGGDVHLCTGPLYHAAPLAFSMSIPLAFGATVVLMESWDAARALQLIEEHTVTHTHMVPTMFHRLLSLPEEQRRASDVSSVRHVLHGAAPCPVPVKHRMIEWFGPVVVEYYAATEGVGSFVDAATWLQRPGTVGLPITPEQVVIGDEEGNALPRGEVGLIYLRAPEGQRFSYFKDNVKTESAYRGSYFTLGDVGYFDDDGYLYLTDRSANLIISGGVNVYPAEIDGLLLEHPAVADAATIGVPNEEWGEEVLSIVELQRGAAPSDALADELITFCRERLAHFKCPRKIEFIDVLPRQDNGKIYKRLLREQRR
jgi:long-chain acyl-CoA synthetase